MDCTECGHERDEHGDGVVYTACCAMEKYPAPSGDVDRMCECPAYEPPASESTALGGWPQTDWLS